MRCLYQLSQESADVSFGAKICLFSFGLVLLFDMAGYAPVTLRFLALFLILLSSFLLWPIVDDKTGPVLALLVTGIINSVFALDGMAQCLLFATAYCYVWNRIDPRFAKFLHGVLFFAVTFAVVAILPDGYYVQESLSCAALSASSLLGIHDLNLDWTYQGIGSLALFLCLSVCLWNGVRSAIVTTAFLLCLAVSNALLINYLLAHINFSNELIWTLKYRDYFGWRELISHYRQLGALGSDLDLGLNG